MTLIAVMDASVAVSLLVEDGWTARANAGLVRGIVPLLSDFALAELAAVLGKAVRTRRLDAVEASRLMTEAESWAASEGEAVPILPEDVRWVTRHLRSFDLNLRAPDALHLAVASRLGLPAWTFDAGMAAAARTLAVPLADDA